MRKSITQLQTARQAADKYSNPFSNVGPDITKLLIIYGRQSSTKQFVSNVYSAKDQRDGLLEYAKDTLRWSGSIIILIENEVVENDKQQGKRTYGTSGTLPTDSRPGLQIVLDYVESGKCSAILAVDVSRFFRDEYGVEAVPFATICRDHHVTILTQSEYYDFNNPKRQDTSRFVVEAMQHGVQMRKQSEKMLKGRLDKAEDGYIANGIAPIGLTLVHGGTKGKDHTLTSNPHSPQVAALYQRFFDLGADLTTLHNEIVGKPIFSIHPDIDPDTIRLTRVDKNGKQVVDKNAEYAGWTIKNRSGLRHILTNPAYVGHLQFNGTIIKYNAWPPIVPQALWDFADQHLSKYDVNGNEYDRPDRTARYQRKNSEDYGALLAGVRDNGLPVIDGIGGQHCYVQVGRQYETKDGKKLMTEQRRAGYVLKDHSTMDTSHYVASIDVRDLDQIIGNIILENLASNRDHIMPLGASKTLGKHIIAPTIDRIEGQQPITPQTRLQRTINETQVAITRLDRQFNLTQDIMTDAEYRKNRSDRRTLQDKLDRLDRQQKQEALSAEKRARGKQDILTTNDMWHKWPVERKRRLIQILTHSITLELISDGWLRLCIHWDSFIPEYEDCRITTTAYLWRDSVRHWSTAEETTLRDMYTTATRDQILHALSHRSWQSIRDHASVLKLSRDRKETHSLPDNMSVSDYGVMVELGILGFNPVAEFMLYGYDPDKRTWWSYSSSQLDDRS